jgi:mono/diheme cytochrome c family protein
MSPPRGRRPLVPVVTVLLALVVALGSCSDSDDGGDSGGAAGDTAAGAEVYADSCAVCHGSDLRGTSRGPSHLSEVYEPGHHPDESFRAAIANGSRQHHWNFGDMPPVAGLDDDEVDAVIAYIREVQQREGFEAYPPE